MAPLLSVRQAVSSKRDSNPDESVTTTTTTNTTVALSVTFGVLTVVAIVVLISWAYKKNTYFTDVDGDDRRWKRGALVLVAIHQRDGPVQGRFL